MLISENTLRSDPRVMCGLIAESALERLDQDECPAAAQVHALTLVRMLDAYRVNMPPMQPHSGVAAYSPLSQPQNVFGSPDRETEIMEAVESLRLKISSLDRERFSKQIAGSLVAAFHLMPETTIVAEYDKQLLKSFLRGLITALQSA